MNFASGYWQLPVEKRSQEQTGFRVGSELYQFKRLSSGHTDATTAFQRSINALFRGMKGTNLQLFLDDICLATHTWQEHLALLEKVLKLKIKTNLKLRGSECLFGTSTITFIGHQIIINGLKPDPEKIGAIKDLQAPTDA